MAREEEDAIETFYFAERHATAGISAVGYSRHVPLPLYLYPRLILSRSTS